MNYILSALLFISGIIILPAIIGSVVGWHIYITTINCFDCWYPEGGLGGGIFFGFMSGAVTFGTMLFLLVNVIAPEIDKKQFSRNISEVDKN